MKSQETRKMFERWAGRTMLLTRRADGMYMDVDTCRAWAVWQAATDAIHNEPAEDICADEATR